MSRANINIDTEEYKRKLFNHWVSFFNLLFRKKQVKMRHYLLEIV